MTRFSLPKFATQQISRNPEFLKFFKSCPPLFGLSADLISSKAARRVVQPSRGYDVSNDEIGERDKGINGAQVERLWYFRDLATRLDSLPIYVFTDSRSRSVPGSSVGPKSHSLRQSGRGESVSRKLTDSLV